MMLGERVRVWYPQNTSVDEMGEPVCTWAHEDVDNVLVRSVDAGDFSRGDKAIALHPDGVRALFSLAFPKTYARKSLVGCRVSLIDERYGMSAESADDAMRVSGTPYPVHLVRPTQWDMVCEIGYIDG